MNFKFIAQPKIGRLEQITKWLHEERSSKRTGFYCNISVINKAFIDKEAFCVTVKNEAIGFCIFTIHGRAARIDIAEICTSYRGLGAGRFLVEKGLETLRRHGVQVVDLQCVPRESEIFWRRMGFCSIPDNVNNNFHSEYDKPIKLFRPTCESQKFVTSGNFLNVLELYDCEPYACLTRPPTWRWPILTHNNSNILINPIIHPANRNWQLRWKNGDNVIKEDKVKYFCTDSNQWGNYLILTKLPDL